jgi:cytochrome c5
MPRKSRRIAALAALPSIFAGFAALAALMALTACSDPASSSAPTGESALQSSCGAHTTTCTAPAPHYADITPVLDRSCNSCHTGGVGNPWALTNYDDVSAWAESIQQDLSTCAMPPLDGGVAMTPADRNEVLDWVACGALP